MGIRCTLWLNKSERNTSTGARNDLPLSCQQPFTTNHFNCEHQCRCVNSIYAKSTVRDLRNKTSSSSMESLFLKQVKVKNTRQSRAVGSLWSSHTQPWRSKVWTFPSLCRQHYFGIKVHSKVQGCRIMWKWPRTAQLNRKWLRVPGARGREGRSAGPAGCTRQCFSSSCALRVREV